MALSQLFTVVLGLSALLGSVSGQSTFQTKYISQPLDHFRFDKKSGTQWPQRYLYNDNSWGKSSVDFKLPGGCPGPILFYSGNEGPIEAFWGSNGFMKELASAWGGLLVFGEHRYYGESMPFGKDSLLPENAVYLSTEQALADYANLLTELKNNILENATDCPVISFGGSYGGTLTTFFRLKYPQVVIGGLAASAPIGYYANSGWSSHSVNKYTWIDIVNKVYQEAEEGCFETLKEAVAKIQDTGATVEGRAKLASIFHLCKPLDAAQPLTDYFTDAIETIPQENYPYAIGTNPAWPVNATCTKIMESKSQDDSEDSLLQAAAKITDFYYSRKGGACVAGEGQGGIPGGGPGPAAWGSWGFQSCTETLHQFSARGLRSFNFSLKAALEQCATFFSVEPRPNWSELHFGGYAIGDGKTGISNVIFSNGLLDPWHGGGFLKQSMKTCPVFIMSQGAHHLDLRGSNAADPPQVTETRKMERAVMETWIHDYANKDKAEL